MLWTLAQMNHFLIEMHRRFLLSKPPGRRMVSGNKLRQIDKNLWEKIAEILTCVNARIRILKPGPVQQCLSNILLIAGNV